MSLNDTQRLGMPLLQPAQAQKHVTVNEALMRLDGLVNLVLQSRSVTEPPQTVTDGECWGVPSGASGDWAGQAGKIAIGSNGGWIFVPPQAGMRAQIVDLGVEAVHDGRVWVAGALSIGLFGSALMAGMTEAEIAVTAGTTVDTGITIPAGVMVIGAVARVTDALTGSLTSWKLGNAGAEDRFGGGLGMGQGSWARGLLGSPMSFYSPDTIVMTAEGGSFAGGSVRIAVHWLELRIPRS
ncbi:MAG: DUF2793 domain-containing protein [Paracoccus sp. (in: a-proteobacteria)]|uniref:DUF2793 domain-containing protein n=1 Tax=Paracoccus sp. TaxID=267 RepID=UPI0026E0681A|nr:DUF2793 domain-containing protein [Paracoccus sp. (in: a-proteobacteria)]MDO5613861.1 DUF2793 domain-containing protein [Paracoccus sp. (in: a-proteobacteria)]